MTNGPSQAKNSFGTYLWVATLSALAAFAAVYVTIGRPDNERPAAESGEKVKSGKARSRTNPLSTGAMTTFVFKKAPQPLADISFLDAEGEPVSLKDWHGKVVLLNLWATWCAPCREEMPSLDRLQRDVGSDDFEVVALAVDKAGVKGAGRFFQDIKIENLKLFADPTARVGSSLRVVGMPTTILIDTQGREIGRLVGPADWDGEDAMRLLAASLGAGGSSEH
jgi:thiol-disulfide isomerase/thioredoxin